MIKAKPYDLIIEYQAHSLQQVTKCVENKINCYIIV